MKTLRNAPAWFRKAVVVAVAVASLTLFWSIQNSSPVYADSPINVRAVIDADGNGQVDPGEVEVGGVAVQGFTPSGAPLGTIFTLTGLPTASYSGLTATINVYYTIRVVGTPAGMTVKALHVLGVPDANLMAAPDAQSIIVPLTTSSPATVFIVLAAPSVTVNMDVSVGSPPPEGWRWVVAEIKTAADEVKEPENKGHGFFWEFFVVKGTTEITTSEGTKSASAGEGIMLPANQAHSHRYPPQSTVLAFDVRSANDNPDAFHRGTKLFLSDKIALRAASAYKLRVRTFTIPAGSWLAEDSLADPNFVYVIEGTLSTTVGTDVSRNDAGKAFALPMNTKFVASNQGTTPLRYIVADVHP